MRHANERDLDRLGALLDELRSLGGLRERKRGNFQIGSRAFLHFHAHGDEFFADCRTDDTDFVRYPVTNSRQRAAFVRVVRTHLAK